MGELGEPRRRRLAEVVGAMVQDERAKARMTQARLAQRTGTSQQWLSRLERGATEPTTAAIERLFAVFDLQLRVELEPVGADLDGEIDKIAALGDDERTETVQDFGRLFDKLAAVPWVLSGQLAAFLQGAPLRVLRAEFAVARADLGAIAEVFQHEWCTRWNERWMEYGGVSVDPRDPGPMRWRLSGHDVRLELHRTLPRSVTVAVAERRVPVRPLADVEARYPEISRLMRRVRARAASPGAA